MTRIYLDNNATTFVDPSVVDIINHTLLNFPGNPSSPHQFGRESRSLLIKSREKIASFLKVRPKEILFTSSGTEGANMIIRGIMGIKPGHIISSNLEHSCVYGTITSLLDQGCEAAFLSSGMYGAASPEEVAKAIRPDTKLIALMAVNNETGVKTDIASIAQIAEQAKIPLFIDGVALFGKELFHIPSGVSAMAFSGHKFHAPKGCGFVFVKANLKLVPLLTGGEQEYNRRGGTENLTDIAAMAEAVRLLEEQLPAATEKMLNLRNRFEAGLKKELGEMISINGEGERICNTVNIAFLGIDGESLLTFLDMEGIAASHGSACASGALEPSRILLNMGCSMERAASSMRFSISRFTTPEEIDVSVEAIVRIIKKMRA
jgi:cysteine desulfurase